MKNKAFWRAVHSLGHPITIISIVLLLINDHWLRIESPSWWTGKIGDWAWLTFAPLIVALLFAWIIPRRTPNHEKWVGLVSFAFIGLWFATAKTIPAIHSLTTRTLDSLVGWPGSLRMDVTDLITLPALLIGWHIWQNARSDTINARPLAWVMLALGVVSTVATSLPIENYGIVQLCQGGAALFAFVNDHDYAPYPDTYSSSDGGLTWQNANNRAASTECPTNGVFSHSEKWILTNDAQTYEFVPGEAIYLSDDFGDKVIEVDLSQLNRDVRGIYYEERYRSLNKGSVWYSSGPFDAFIDTQTGNLIVAMGHDGVLVRTRDGKWQWSNVGQYYHVELDQIDLPAFLQPELLSALLLFILIPPTVALSSHLRRWYDSLGLIVAWLIWLAVLLLNRFWFNTNTFVLPTIIFVCILIALNMRLIKHYLSNSIVASPLAAFILVPLATCLLFTLPYILWVRGTVPDYTTARIFALVLCCAGVFAGRQYLKYRFPSESNLKDADTNSNV